MENPPEETPGWHSSELETAQVLAHDEQLVRMDRAVNQQVKKPDWFPDSFIKLDGAPEVEFQGYQYFLFPTDHCRLHAERRHRESLPRDGREGGEDVRALRRAPGCCARGVPEGSGRGAHAGMAGPSVIDRAMTQQPGVALIGTLDTKGDEIAYVRDRLIALGTKPLVIDSGILGEPGIKADVAREDVAREAGYDLAQVQAAGSRGAAVELMIEGVRAVCLRLWLEGRINGVLCLGGAEGALLGAAAMHALPVGVPKLIVSPSASGRRAFGPFVGESDVLVMHSVIDILGLNPIARSVFDNAAAAVAGMARDAGQPVSELGGRSVGITMLGHTTPAVMRIRGCSRARRPRARHLPRQRRRRPGDGEACCSRCPRGRDRLHALRGRKRTARRPTRHGPGAPDGGREARSAPGSRSRVRRLLQPGSA